MRRFLLALVVCLTFVPLAAPALAGPVGGFTAQRALVPGNTTHTYSYRMVPGARATVIVIGDGDTDLDLFVYDQFGNLVASDTDTSDDCAVVFVPAAAGPYTIHVKNLGGIANAYRIVVK
jgi:hypothetical protein